MKIVITGALGHIGSKLIRDIPQAFPDAELVLIDNMMTQRYSSLFHLPKNANYSFIEKDILLMDLEETFRGADFVVHLAAITNAENSFKRQHEVEEVNFTGTEKVANACLKTGSKLIYLSTTSVYGSQSNLVDENCTELKPQSPYADSKLKGEELLISLKNSGLKFIICRFGTICGVSEGMRFQTAVNKFCWNAVLGQAVQVWATALYQKRPYLALQDGIDSIIFIIRNDLLDGEVYNIVTENHTVNDILDFIRKDIPDLKVGMVNTEIMNQLSYEVSTDKFRKKGFQCKGSVENEVKQTLELFQPIMSGK